MNIVDDFCSFVWNWLVRNSVGVVLQERSLEERGPFSGVCVCETLLLRLPSVEGSIYEQSAGARRRGVDCAR